MATNEEENIADIFFAYTHTRNSHRTSDGFIQ